MQNRIDRQVPGTLDDIAGQLLEVLDRHGFTVSQPDTGDSADVRILQITDPDGITPATDVDPDAATTATAASASARPTTACRSPSPNLSPRRP